MNALAIALAVCLEAQDPKTDPPKADELPIEAYWKDGLRFRTKDGNFEAHVGGRAILHARTFFDRPDDGTAPLRTVPDSFFFREAYLESSGTLNGEVRRPRRQRGARSC
jgi:hypothetical protein